MYDTSAISDLTGQCDHAPFFGNGKELSGASGVLVFRFRGCAVNFGGPLERSTSRSYGGLERGIALRLGSKIDMIHYHFIGTLHDRRPYFRRTRSIKAADR